MPDTYINPAETGFYYLGSRYYDPEIGRFINADSTDILSVNQGNLLQYNLFAYCLNDPVNKIDPTGEIAITTCIFIASIVAGLLASGYVAYNSEKYTGKIDWENTIVAGMSTIMFVYSMGMTAYGMYTSICQYKGYQPVTEIGASKKINNTTDTFIPNEAYTKKASKTGTPNSIVIHYKYNERTECYEKSTVCYDFAGRQTLRIDWTDHGFPFNHTNPHVHVIFFNSQYPFGFGERR